ncbi:MAG: GNAT family N-acetyltransferase [Actinomycetia bacterium]|nr:GNAT family N-acetyltransferase [Actinomycetes bacterium]MCP4225325.1 GNAT family N-acetyltransferase [Actinomycetes bacterium]MCP5033580.1 GNAT family N-acetyltransferase [Actinomycetes bacterium]
MDIADHWPLFRLRITTPRLLLRVPTDEDLVELVEVAKAGVHDPMMMPFTVGWTDSPSPELEQGALQYWWRCRAGFTPEDWDLTLAVVYEGRLVGAQSLSASNFVELRTAETGSWLGQSAHGQGIGREMRAAMVHFAFEYLGALAVISSAFTDNIASQRVSMATGYEPNGIGYAVRRGQRDEQLRFLLTRDRWEETRSDVSIEVEGHEASLPLFGLS